MRICNIVPHDDPILHEIVSTTGTTNRHEMSKLMVENMRHHGGIGLSANQIGWHVRCFSMELEGKVNPIVCYNPKVITFSEFTTTLREGCLSFSPNVVVDVERPNWIDATYEDEDGIEITRKFHGLDAKVFQHELDHLNGILMTERGKTLHL